METKKNRILMIDDDKSILKLFTRILQNQGYEVDAAETGDEALKKIATSSFDLALIDVKLPDMDGIDLSRRMNSTHPHIIKIVITGFPSIENGVKALESGVDAYLVKPVKPEDLIKMINERMKYRH